MKRCKAWKLVNFQDIAKYHNVSITALYKPGGGKNGGSLWQLVYGRIQYKSDFPTVKTELLAVPCFYIRKVDALCKRLECKIYKQIFTGDENLIKHLKEAKCTGDKTKIICSGAKFRHLLNLSEKVFMVVIQTLLTLLINSWKQKL